MSLSNLTGKDARQGLKATLEKVRSRRSVTQAAAKVGLADKHNRVAGQVANFGLLKPEDANIQQHLTGKSLDGLCATIGEEERNIRQDPVGTGSAILQQWLAH